MAIMTTGTVLLFVILSGYYASAFPTRTDDWLAVIAGEVSIIDVMILCIQH